MLFLVHGQLPRQILTSSPSLAPSAAPKGVTVLGSLPGSHRLRVHLLLISQNPAEPGCARIPLLRVSDPLQPLPCSGADRNHLLLRGRRGEEAGERHMAKYLCAKCSFSGLTIFSADAYLEEKMKGALPAPLVIHLLVTAGHGWCYGGLTRRILVILTVDFMGSQLQTQLDHDRLLGSVPARSPFAWRGCRFEGQRHHGVGHSSSEPGSWAHGFSPEKQAEILHLLINESVP